MQRLAILPAFALLAACGGNDVSEPTTSFYRDVQPLLDRSCNGCHVEGGIAPFPLTTFEDAAVFRDQIAFVTENRIMPPWPPGPGCNDYVGERTLSDADIVLLGRWAAEGGPEGNPADAQPPPEMAESALSRVDVRAQMDEPYTPRKEPDDYRCFVIDWPLERPTYVTGFVATPGTAAVVHHVIAFQGKPEDAATYEALDAAEPGPGYTCFGGPGGDLTRVGWLGAWVPGIATGDFPEGTGIKVEPGTKIILQVHYNTSSAGPLPDQTTLEMKVDDTVEKEAMIVPITDISWVLGHQMAIPPDRADVTHSTSIPPSWISRALGGAVQGDMLVHAAALHMHTRGTSGTLRVDPAGDDTCLLDIPRWDFHWQGLYRLATPYLLKAGQEVELTCHWDSRGEKTELNWGEGTGDEMCLGVLYVSQP